MYGSDQAASIEAHALRNFVETMRKVPSLLGSGLKALIPAELEVRKKLRVEVAD
jgi:sialic acid synthase SpsE